MNNIYFYLAEPQSRRGEGLQNEIVYLRKTIVSLFIFFSHSALLSATGASNTTEATQQRQLNRGNSTEATQQRQLNRDNSTEATQQKTTQQRQLNRSNTTEATNASGISNATGARDIINFHLPFELLFTVRATLQTMFLVRRTIILQG